MLDPIIIAAGDYRPEDVQVFTHDEYLINLSEDFQKKLDDIWDQQLQKARDGRYDLWDSECYALKSCNVEDNKLHLNLGLVNFKTVKGTAVLIEKGLLGEEFASRQLYSSMIIRTIDDFYLFGIGGSQIFIGELKFVGGVYSKKEQPVKDGQSLFKAPLNELTEELNVQSDQVEFISLQRIYATPRGLTDLCFRIQLKITAQEVNERFALREDKELSGLLVFNHEEAKKAVASLKDWRNLKADLI